MRSTMQGSRTFSSLLSRALCALGSLCILCASPRAVADDPPRSDKFSGPRRDVPSRDFGFEHLRVEATFDWEEESVHATVTHRAHSLRSGARSLELDAVGIAVESVSLAGGPELTHESHEDKLTIDLGKEVPRGDAVELQVRYSARPKQGLYFVKPSKAEPERPLQLWSQGEAQEARHWIPCFDHPSDKVTSELIVTVPAGLTVVSNGRLVSAEPAGEKLQKVHWIQDKPHATYLIALAVGDFAVWEDSSAGVTLRGYTQKRLGELAARSFANTGSMIELFNERTGYPYPWDKYDQICVVDFPFGGMENTSATILTESTLHDERAALDESSDGLVAHELAHQWFGDLVTCKDWGDIWLNESFATFFENLYREHHLGWDEGVHGRFEEGEAYKREDRSEYRRPLSTRSWRAPEDLFDSHTYPKGARILSMLRYVLGDERFFAGIRRYLQRNAFRSVETADFREALEEASGEGLGWFFDQWVLSGGHPEYQVSTRWDSTTSMLEVEVLQTQKVDDLTPLFRMPVELAVVTAEGRQERRVWVSGAKQTLSLPCSSRPRMVRFDPKDWILKDLRQERSVEELVYQLEKDPEASGRREAATALEAFISDPRARESLLGCWPREAFWGVRERAAQTLGTSKSKDVGEALAARLEKEPKSAARGAMIDAIATLLEAKAAPILRKALKEDPSYRVAATSLRALGRVVKEEARPDALAALDRDENNESLRVAAIVALGALASSDREARAEVVARLVPLTRPGNAPGTRMAALASLGGVGKDLDDAFNAVAEVARSARGHLTLSAIGALGALGGPRALEVLRELRATASPLVLRNPIEAIDRAIERIEKGAGLDGIQAELKALRERTERLEQRLNSGEGAK